MSKLIKGSEVRALSLSSIRTDALQEEGLFSALHELLQGVQTEGPGPEGEEPSSRSASDEARVLLEEARAEAARLRREAQELLAEARAKAQEIESRAYDQGFEQGKKDGEELGRRQYEAMAQRLERLISSMETQLPALKRANEEALLRLVSVLASKLALKEMELDPSYVGTVLEKALSHVVQGASIKVYLNPKDLELAKEALVRLGGGPGEGRLELLPSPEVTRGGCLIETEFGLVDATVESRREALEAALEEALKERTGGPRE